MARPINTTANPDWMNATCSLDLVPKLDRNREEAELFVNLCGKFLITQGPEAGKRLEDCWLPWQKDALMAAYQCRETFLLLGKGSGKSLSAAAYALGICMLNALRNKNSRGLVVCVAPTIPSAKIVFEHILEAILADDELRKSFKSNVQDRSLTHQESGIKIAILAAEMRSVVGKRPLALIIDEVHEIGNLNEGLQVCNQLRQGGRNFGDDFRVLGISTMPIGQPKGEFKRLHDYAVRVRDGAITDDQFCPILYNFPLKERPDLDPMDQANWWRGMPSLRTPYQRGTMNASELDDELKTAASAEDGESFQLLLSQRLGILKNLDQDSATSVMHAKFPDAPICGRDIPRQGSAVVGIDVGGIDDPMALALLSLFESGHMELRVWQYLTQAGYDRAHGSTQQIYDEAIAAGTLTIAPTTEGIDAALEARCKEIMAIHTWATIGGDEHGRGGFKRWFEQSIAGFTSVPQTWVLGAALSKFESLLLDGKISHCGCPLLVANVANTLIEESPNGNRRIKKADGLKSGQGSAKIDGVSATLSALHLADSVDVLPEDISYWVA